MKFSDIQQMTRGIYSVNISWKYLRGWFDYNNEGEWFINLDPPYQRGYVWNMSQKISYIEYILRGGTSGRDIYWNCPGWQKVDCSNKEIQIVDGKQRIEAVFGFLDSKIRAFGYLYKDFEDQLVSACGPDFIFHVNDFQSQIDVVEWYLGMNTGGSIHTEKDLKSAYEYMRKLKSIGD